VVGDHETLNTVADELRARGDEVVRVAHVDEEAERSAVNGLVADAAQVRVLVIGYATAEGRARRALSLIRSLIASGGAAAQGRVVLVAGRDYLGWPGRAESAIELAGAVGLGRSLALELGTQGITVNIVCPPAELGAVTATEDPWAAPPPPLTGPVDDTDVAYAVAFLSDPASGYITGQVIHVSGGLNVLSSLSA
jgi:hypothetical protein